MSIKRLFFDVETSYYQGWFWGTGRRVSISADQILKHQAIICLCYKWEGQNKVHSLEWKKGDDSKLVKDFIKVIVEADEVVGHNSDRFDLKKFRTRCILSGVRSLPQFKTIDTLKIARKEFAFPSNKLNDLSKYLGGDGKMETGGIILWHKVILLNCKKAMAKMVKYCKKDVLETESLYQKIVGFSTPKTNVAVKNGGDKADCPYCGSDQTRIKDRVVSVAGTIKIRMSCKCGKFFTTSLKAFNDKEAQKRIQGHLLKRY